jgi:hypothetical protein
LPIISPQFSHPSLEYKCTWSIPSRPNSHSIPFSFDLSLTPDIVRTLPPPINTPLDYLSHLDAYGSLTSKECRKIPLTSGQSHPASHATYGSNLIRDASSYIVFLRSMLVCQHVY